MTTGLDVLEELCSAGEALAAAAQREVSAAWPLGGCNGGEDSASSASSLFSSVPALAAFRHPLTSSSTPAFSARFSSSMARCFARFCAFLPPPPAAP
eukprot:CAMPEP_0175690258 /NCGR_PEP_ID=MMETSP0097-20121207/29800_1 /TAXON_ID=311494 /ORGANISM="Alexandrium monilatum, Strain CCMP3105" /LENGTH=96 /DNA_ID=CAMNT_0016997293 /DNA_START=35 /DNA_END=322 /DNA_ORIENTATION=+